MQVVVDVFDQQFVILQCLQVYDDVDQVEMQEQCVVQLLLLVILGGWIEIGFLGQLYVVV